MSRITVADLKKQILDLADMNDAADRSTSFIDNDRLLDYINLEASELYDLLVTHYQDQILADDKTYTLVSGTSTYDLPEDFYKLSELDLLISGSTYYPIRRFGKEDRNVFTTYSTTVAPGAEQLRYRLRGRFLEFVPSPSAAGTVRMRYVPEYKKLTEDSDQLDWSFVNGWEDMIIHGAAGRCLIREESDATVVLTVKAAIKNRIVGAAANRDAYEPTAVARTWQRSRWRRRGVL